MFNITHDDKEYSIKIIESVGWGNNRHFIINIDCYALEDKSIEYYVSVPGFRTKIKWKYAGVYFPPFNNANFTYHDRISKAPGSSYVPQPVQDFAAKCLIKINNLVIFS